MISRYVFYLVRSFFFLDKRILNLFIEFLAYHIYVYIYNLFGFNHVYICIYIYIIREENYGKKKKNLEDDKKKLFEKILGEIS